MILTTPYAKSKQANNKGPSKKNTAQIAANSYATTEYQIEGIRSITNQ